MIDLPHHETQEQIADDNNRSTEQLSHESPVRLARLVLKTDANKTDISCVQRDSTVERVDRALTNVVDRLIDDDNVVVQALTRGVCNGRADGVLHLLRNPQ